MSSLLDRLRERKLVRWAVAYVASSWVLYEVSDVIGGRWGLPDVIYQGPFILLPFGEISCDA